MKLTLTMDQVKHAIADFLEEQEGIYVSDTSFMSLLDPIYGENIYEGDVIVEFEE